MFKEPVLLAKCVVPWPGETRGGVSVAPIDEGRMVTMTATAWRRWRSLDYFVRLGEPREFCGRKYFHFYGINMKLVGRAEAMPQQSKRARAKVDGRVVSEFVPCGCGRR